MVFGRFRKNYLLSDRSNHFKIKAQPFQFIMCGAIQLTIDILLIAQLTKYGDAYDSLDSTLPE